LPEKEKTNLIKVSENDFKTAVSTIEKSIPLLEKGTENAVLYVKESRLKRQKEDVLGKIKEHLLKEKVQSEVIDGELHVFFDSGFKSRIEEFGMLTAGAWSRACIGGLEARIKKEWELYDEYVSDSLKILDLMPPVIEKMPDMTDVEKLKMPSLESIRALSFGAAFVKILGSAAGILWMAVMLFSLFMPFVDDVFGYYPLFAMPLFFLLAIYFAWKKAGKLVEERLVDNVTELSEIVLEKADEAVDLYVDRVELEISGQIEKFNSLQESSFNAWSFAVRLRIDEIQKS